MQELSPADKLLANRIIDKLISGETICCLDFPEVDEQRFESMMEWIERTMNKDKIH